MGSSAVPFTVLFVGAGNITFGNDNVLWNHSLRIEQHLGPRLKVVGIVDPSLARVQQVLEQKKNSLAAKSYSYTRHFLDVAQAKEGLTDSPPALVILGSPPFFRGTTVPGRNLEQQLIDAFGATPAIFCEKPVATSRPNEPYKVTAELQSSGNIVGVGYMLRYLKVVQKCLDIIRENNLTIMSIGARYTCAYQRIRKIDWWDKSKQCGPIVEQATHFADLCRYIGGEVNMNSVQAIALEHFEPAGSLKYQAIDESTIDPQERIPRVTTAFWKYENGGIGTLTHVIALHGIKYSNEIVVAADGFQFRLVDLYVKPKLYIRTPKSEEEEEVSFAGDDPFYSELAGIIDSADAISKSKPASGLCSYDDAVKTYEFTWRIRDQSEQSTKRALLK